jgi:hypothetical protein
LSPSQADLAAGQLFRTVYHAELIPDELKGYLLGESLSPLQSMVIQHPANVVSCLPWFAQPAS